MNGEEPSRRQPAPARVPERGLATVAEQMAAALERFGLPHEGTQLGGSDTAEPERLVEGLRRALGANKGERPPRGAGLANAALVRAQAEAVLAAIDQLPDMARYSPEHVRERSEAARERLREALDGLVAAASSPARAAPRGAAAARLDALMTAADDAAAALERELARAGGTPDEQEAQFFGAPGGPITFAQYLEWVRQCAAPFAGTGGAPALRPDEMALLGAMLDALHDVGDALARRAPRASARRRVDALAGLLAGARARMRDLSC